jgi:predicted RNase H-like HicB family nuclease
MSLFDKPPTGRRYTRPMSDPLHLTIVYEPDPESDWIMVSIPEIPGVLSQGRTREEAREMILDALAGMLELRAAEYEPGAGVERESLAILTT